MALPVVAIVGRPNVGKSTLVNRIARKNEAIVHEMRGVTRDRSYHEADWNGVHFMLIDTGGIEMGDEDAFQKSIREQAFAGANEADVVIFLVDGRTGATPDDIEVARVLRKSGKPVLLTVNKLDNPDKKTRPCGNSIAWAWATRVLFRLRTATARAICSTKSSKSSPSFPRMRKLRKKKSSTSLLSAVRMRAKALLRTALSALTVLS